MIIILIYHNKLVKSDDKLVIFLLTWHWDFFKGDDKLIIFIKTPWWKQNIMRTYLFFLRLLFVLFREHNNFIISSFLNNFTIKMPNMIKMKEYLHPTQHYFLTNLRTTLYKKFSFMVLNPRANNNYSLSSHNRDILGTVTYWKTFALFIAKIIQVKI